MRPEILPLVFTPCWFAEPRWVMLGTLVKGTPIRENVRMHARVALSTQSSETVGDVAGHTENL